MKSKIIIILLSVTSTLSLYSQNGKKVYADYHGIRTTREMDATFNLWKYTSLTTGTSNGPKSLAYNPDIILENGRHEIAAANYPLVGMQSQFDPDYLEYQILSAKTAKIDGFWIEWGYIDHSSNTLLNTMMPIAEKYSFELGVNICDGWLFDQDWITSVRPEVVTRDDKLKYFKECMQYLIDNVFTGSTAPRVNGKPVFYLFADGITPSELQWIENQQYDLPDGTSFPVILKRTVTSGTIGSNGYIPGSPSAAAAQWSETSIIPTSWLPERKRAGTPTSSFPDYDYYALGSDAVAYLHSFNNEIWSDPTISVRSGFVTPGMNNIGCANWSNSGARFYMINRNNGNTYRNMWQYNIDNKSNLDMVFIASWSDYNEGHEIEPTIQNSDRELRTTLQYAAQLKDETANDLGIALPKRLFDLRKKIKFFQKIGITQTSASNDLDLAGLDIAAGNYTNATNLISSVETAISILENDITKKDINVPSADLKIAGTYTNPTEGEFQLNGQRFAIGLPAEIRGQLGEENYECYFNFEYFDSGRSNINIAQKKRNELPSTYNIAAQINQDNKQEWRKVKVRLYPSNMLLNGSEWVTQNADLSIYGTTIIRNMSFDLSVFNLNYTTSARSHFNSLESYSEDTEKVTVYSLTGNKLFVSQSLFEAKLELKKRAKGAFIVVEETEKGKRTFKVLN